YPHSNDSVLEVGIAIDDCDADNGPVLVLPGSHRGPVHDHHVDGRFCGAIDPVVAGLDCSGAVELLAPAGSVTLHHVRMVHGSGEATLEWKTRAVVGAIEDLKPLLIGRDPRDIRQNLRALVKHGFWRLGIIGMTAVSGLEHAMWDILGKSVGEPVWRLLGGRVRDKVRIYT